MGRTLLGVLAFGSILAAQMITGRLEGAIVFPDGRPRAGEALKVRGGAGFEIIVHTDSQGRFALVLPYGLYRVAGLRVQVVPMATTHVDLVQNPSVDSIPQPRQPNLARRTVKPGPFSVQGDLSILDPATVSEPLDFTGLADSRLTLLSLEGFSWTATQFQMEGLDATDSYQPGRPLMLPDVQALETAAVRSAFALTTSASYGNEAGVFLAQPDARWHGALQGDGTGAFLASGNLPALRDGVEQSDRYDWLTRDHAEIGGPITRWADLFASGSGQWSSQTIPLAPIGTGQRSRMLYGNARGRVRAGARDRLDALYSGSRIDLSSGGMPAGIEALAGRRMSPQFELPGGFAGQAEVDHLDFVQTGWTHAFAADSILGAIETRFGYSTAHLDTRPATASVPDQSRIELVGSVVTGAPPLDNFAVRTRHQIETAWQSGVLRTAGMRHELAAGAGWKISSPRNRFTAPSDLNLITANGAPAFVVEFNTPLDSRARVNSSFLYASDHVVAPAGLTFDLGLLADFSRGGIPAQSSGAGTFSLPRTFAAQPDLIVWNSRSPRAGFAWEPPHGHGLKIQGAWSRLLSPMAGRYLDFGNPNSLGGSEYQWIDSSGAGWFQPGGQGPLLMRFGGPYSSIAPSLQRPYADEIHLGAAMTFAHSVVAGIRLFRRDEKHRIAAIDTGVPPEAFTPKAILDPGPDGIPGTFDDQPLTVWAQNPATFGQDRYLLTNPAGLRMLNTGLVAETGGAWRGVTMRASFVAEKSYGPTNPGDAVSENDPGVVGALFLDPNTSINAANRSFMDRAFVGKLQVIYRLPAAFGGIELASVANYTDGLVFARQLLVTGLPQGPFLVATTVRGSPEGGNRAQYVMNWNLRVKRDFPLRFGSLAAAADIMNLANAGRSVQESDWSGPSFNMRLPVAIQPPRFVRLELRYDF
jgi:hypothetical protein